MSDETPKGTGIPGENGWAEKPSAEQLGLTGNDEGVSRPHPADAPQMFSAVLESGPTPADETERLNRAVTFIATPVEGLAYVAAATGGNGLEVKAIDYRKDLPGDRPLRISDSRAVAEVQSFKDEITRKPLLEHSTLWASESKALITAVYDEHTNDRPGYREDRLQLQLRADEEWQTWHKISGKFMSQEEFGDVIEELLHTVVRPDQADLMEVIESVRVSSGTTFESGVRRSDGQIQLSYREESTTRAGQAGDLEVPQTITVAIKPWEGITQRYQVEAWFRTRVQNGSLSLAIKLKPTRPVLLAAWADLRADLATFAERPVLAVP